MKKLVLALLCATTLVACGGGYDYDSDYDSDSYDDPSNTVPGYDYGDSLTEDYEYCKDVGNAYEAQGSGSNEDGYNACLDVLDNLGG